MSIIFLAHHGIEGQKWGVRRYQNEDGSLTSEGRKRYQRTGSEKTSKDYARKNPRKLTSEELKTANARMQLEKDYIDKTRSLSTKKRVLAKMGDTLLDTAAKVLSSTVTSIAKAKVDAYLKDRYSSDAGGKGSKKK